MQAEKRCPKCRETKPLSEFHRDSTRKDGHYTRCKVCVAEYHRANADLLSERSQIWQLLNPDRYRVIKARYEAKVRARKQAERAAS